MNEFDLEKLKNLNCFICGRSVLQRGRSAHTIHESGISPMSILSCSQDWDDDSIITHNYDIVLDFGSISLVHVDYESMSFNWSYKDGQRRFIINGINSKEVEWFDPFENPVELLGKLNGISSCFKENGTLP